MEPSGAVEVDLEGFCVCWLDESAARGGCSAVVTVIGSLGSTVALDGDVSVVDELVVDGADDVVVAGVRAVSVAGVVPLVSGGVGSPGVAVTCPVAVCPGAGGTCPALADPVVDGADGSDEAGRAGGPGTLAPVVTISLPVFGSPRGTSVCTPPL
jgi:hypothetical protein